ncbi:MAG: hypothetical protein LUQ33_06700 [Methanoregulaceae archaeon]|jgi:hypothetical protein|nr:hypothetical protein [Methanoregulaceae archaeon]
MKCPVCGDDCVREAHEIIGMIPAVFARCSDCRMIVLDKSLPPPPDAYHESCRCGRRFLDEVFAHIYAILVREGLLTGREALRDVGSPLLHPGYQILKPPFLPKNSLVLLSRYPDHAAARMIVDEIPEVRGVVRSGAFIPGVIDPGLKSPPRSYELLAGCDVRANIFPTKAGPIVVYQQQSTIHIEFPRGHNPKISSVEERIARMQPEWFVDACCGAGTLGLTAARLGIPHLVLNDTWYAAAFWAAYNTGVNREFFRIDEVKIHTDYSSMAEHPVGDEPVLIAETEGAQEIRVYQGDFHKLPYILPKVPVLAVIDLFDKSDRDTSGRILRDWMAQVNGEAFIP